MKEDPSIIQHWTRLRKILADEYNNKLKILEKLESINDNTKIQLTHGFLTFNGQAKHSGNYFIFTEGPRTLILSISDLLSGIYDIKVEPNETSIISSNNQTQR